VSDHALDVQARRAAMMAMVMTLRTRHRCADGEATCCNGHEAASDER